MSKYNEAIINRLNKLYADNMQIKKLDLKINDKYVIFSDLHLGDGGKADNFSHNEETMIFALKYYKNNRYSIILLGDIEEFWQFDFASISNRYSKTIYELLRSFPSNTVHRIFGNHDKEWSEFTNTPDPIEDTGERLHGSPEAIMLDKDILLVHGHQGDKMSDKNAWLSRSWVRAFKVIEPIARIFGYENYSATKSQIPKDRERVYYSWAKDNKIILICGHTHRAIFASRSYYEWLKKQIKLKKFVKEKSSTDRKKKKKLSKEIRNFKKELRIEKRRGRDINPLETNREPLPCYFNSGSGLYRKGITNIEVEKDKIRLIKWQADVSLSLEKRRIELWEEENLTDLRKKLNRKPV